MPLAGLAQFIHDAFNARCVTSSNTMQPIILRATLNKIKYRKLYPYEDEIIIVMSSNSCKTFLIMHSAFFGGHAKITFSNILNF